MTQVSRETGGVDPKAIVRDGYDVVSYAYRRDDEQLSSRSQPRMDHLLAMLGRRPRILDLGCGCGVPLARFLAERGARVTGVDISPVQIERGRRLVPSAYFVCDDMATVDFPVGAFDAVVAWYSIIHLPLTEQRPLFERISRWLVPGGVFMAVLGADAWTGTEENWLGVEGGTMYWSHADARTYRDWLEECGLRVIREEFVPEGDGGHQLFFARR